MRRGRAGLIVCASLLCGLAVAGEAEGPLYYYVEDAQVVITNTPSRDDLQPVPGMQEPAGGTTR